MQIGLIAQVSGRGKLVRPARRALEFLVRTGPRTLVRLVRPGVRTVKLLILGGLRTALSLVLLAVPGGIRGRRVRRLGRFAVELGGEGCLEGVAARSGPVGQAAGDLRGRAAVRPGDGTRRGHADPPEDGR
jgi:hypothetical protein